MLFLLFQATLPQVLIRNGLYNGMRACRFDPIHLQHVLERPGLVSALVAVVPSRQEAISVREQHA